MYLLIFIQSNTKIGIKLRTNTAYKIQQIKKFKFHFFCFFKVFRHIFCRAHLYKGRTTLYPHHFCFVKRRPVENRTWDLPWSSVWPTVIHHYRKKNILYTDKKENEIFPIYKEIQMGSVAKSYMRKGS
jgi:hypothetical protein